MSDLREQGYELWGLREDVHIFLLDGFGDCGFGLVVEGSVFGSEMLAGDSLQWTAGCFFGVRRHCGKLSMGASHSQL
jgi:hypothetical protein